MTRIALCDDDPSMLDQLEALVRPWYEAARRPVRLDRYGATAPLLAALEDGDPYDALFLDIHIDGRASGMALAETLRKRRQSMLIVFVTGFLDYALRGYEVQALRYLVKPVRPADVQRCLEAVETALARRAQQSFYFRIDRQDARVRYEDILFFESFSHTVELHALSGAVHAFSQRLSDLERDLPPDFVRCHRSMIVNIQHVFSIKRDVIELDTGRELPLSQRRRPAVLQAFLEQRA